MQLSGELTGQTTISGTVVSPNGRANLLFTITGDGAAAATGLSAPIPVPEKSEAGVWHVATLAVLNQQSFFLSKGFSAATVPPGGRLEVIAEESDTTPPEVRGITIDSFRVRDGEKNRIRVDAFDDQSGVASVKGQYQSPSKSATVWFVCSLNRDSGQWEGDIAIPARAECGEWTIQQVRVADMANNLTVLPPESPIAASASFSVMGSGDCDDAAPTLEQQLMLSPTRVSNATDTSIQVTAQVRDAGSGMLSAFGYASPEVPGTAHTQIYFTLSAQDPKSPDSPWVGQILIPRAAAKGTWKVAFFHVEDKAHNARNYSPGDPLLAEAIFIVE